MQLAHQEEELGLCSRVSRDNLVHAPQRRHARLCARQVAFRKQGGAGGSLSSGSGGGLRSTAADVAEVAVLAGPVVQHLH